jgi:hypothetical protein
LLLDKISRLSIIVPVHPSETSWAGIVEDMRVFPDGTEIIFVGPKEPEGLLDAAINRHSNRFTIKMIDSELGRGKQLNAGAKEATGDVFWFIHADSRVNRKGMMLLNSSLEENPGALYYYNLRFQSGSSPLMELNKYGSYIRSHLMNLPFGDQAFAMVRDTFEKIGGYDESGVGSEDHLFVLAAIRNKVQIKCTGGVVYTSSRKYKREGWLKTTSKHLIATASVSAKDFWSYSEKVAAIRQMTGRDQ